MEIIVDGNHLKGGKDLYTFKTSETTLFIPIIFDGWSDENISKIKHYRIDKIEVLESDRSEENKKESIVIKQFHTPDRYGRKRDKTTAIVNPQALTCEAIVCEAIVTGENCREKLKSKPNCKAEISFITESGNEIKREIELKMDKVERKSKRKRLERIRLSINFILFFFTFFGLTYWNFKFNSEPVYGQFGLFKSSIISLLIGAMGGYFCISNLALFSKIREIINGNLKGVIRYPELHFGTDFVKKLKTQIATWILIVLTCLTLYLWFLQIPVRLPVPKIEYFSFYDSRKNVEINEKYIYAGDIPIVRMGVNDKKSINKEPIYFASLINNKKGELEPSYNEFTINEGIGITPTKFSFEELTNQNKLGGNKKRVFDFVCGKKPGDDRLKISYDAGAMIFTITFVDWFNKDELLTGLENFYNENVISSKLDLENFMTNGDKILCSYKNEFIKSIKKARKSVTSEGLVEVFKNYTGLMTGNTANDIKCMRLIWCQFHAATGYGITISDQQITEMLGLYESYYNRGDIKGIGDIAKSITRGYFRLLLYIEKNFTEKEIPENAYNNFHKSFEKILDSKGKGAGYYLFYLKECVRHKALFVKYAKPGESRREVFFTNKIENFRMLSSAEGKLKEIANMKEADKKVRIFIGTLIQGLSNKSSSLGKVGGDTYNYIISLMKNCFIGTV